MSRMSNLAIIIDDLRHGKYYVLDALNQKELEFIIIQLLEEEKHGTDTLH